MKVGVIRQFGGPESILIEEREKPVPAPGEVLLRLHAAGLNRADMLVREGSFFERSKQQPLPLVLGVEGAGEVVELGENVTTHKIGERVAILPMRTCGHCKACEEGNFNGCPDLAIFGEHFDGTYAQYIAVPARNALKVPDGPTYQELSVSIVAYMTAWHMLCTRGELQAGETVLIVGAGSGTGSAALQLAKACGARAIATTGSAEKRERLLQLGADDVIDYSVTPDWDKVVRDLTSGRGVDLAHDTVGGATIQKTINSLCHRGRLVAMGSHSGRHVEIDLTTIYRNEIDIRGCHTANRNEIDAFLPLLASGKLRPVVDSVFQLEEAQAAHRRLAGSERFGKVVLSID